MSTRTTTYDYEVSSESGRERHIRIPYARLEDVTPVLHDPCAVLCAVAGARLTGTIITLDATDEVVIINIAKGATYWHNVRNVITYDQAAEATFRALNIGDLVYYDDSATMPADVFLSTSPLNAAGVANDPYGYIALNQDEDADSYPKGTSGGGTSHVCAIVQD